MVLSEFVVTTTINKVAILDTYALPKVEDLFSTLSGGQSFTKLDLSHAYQQVELESQFQKYLTINTHKGLYKYKNSAPSIFQRLMKNVLQGLSRVCVYIDDIITGQTEAEHTKNIEAVLQRLHSVDMRLKKEKCSWPEVEYLSHKISKHGIEPTMEKVRAITEAPHPKNVAELRAFLGLSSTEQRYSQLDKEALAIVAGVKKFHQYLASRRFEINTDHKPLIYIFDQHRGNITSSIWKNSKMESNFSRI